MNPFEALGVIVGGYLLAVVGYLIWLSALDLLDEEIEALRRQWRERVGARR